MIVTIDELDVSFNMQVGKKGQLGPIKAWVCASRSKQMVLDFFYDRGIVFTNYAPKANTVSIAYIMESLGSFLKIFCMKRPIMVSQD